MAGLNGYLLGALCLGAFSSLWGSSPAIGTATAKGSFTVNKSQVSGSATLFDGSLVETRTAASRLQMNDGSRFDLNANSSLTVRGSEAVLEKGSGEFGPAAGFNLQARTLRIETEGADAKAEVRMSGDRSVLVKALTGSVRVFSKTGVLVARVNPGAGVMLDPYAAPADDFNMSGCLLVQRSGAFYGLAVDSALYQLTGANLTTNVGNRVHIVGTTGAAAGAGLKGATAVVAVTKMEVTDVGGCLAAAARFEGMSATRPAGTPAATPGTKGGSAPAKAGGAAAKSNTPIIAGVAVAAAGGGIAALVLSKSK